MLCNGYQTNDTMYNCCVFQYIFTKWVVSFHVNKGDMAHWTCLKLNLKKNPLWNTGFWTQPHQIRKQPWHIMHRLRAYSLNRINVVLTWNEIVQLISQFFRKRFHRYFIPFWIEYQIAGPNCIQCTHLASQCIISNVIL